MLAPHGNVLVEDLAGLLDLELLHAEEAQQEVGIKADPLHVGLGFDPFTHLVQGLLSSLVILLKWSYRFIFLSLT